MKQGYVETTEGQIHYIEDGSGEHVMLLHQSPMSAEEYIYIIPIIGRHYHVVAWDMPGRGNSYDPSTEYIIEDFAGHIIQFLNALSIERASIAGHHDGAMMAVEVAAANPQRISNLVLNGCAAWPKSFAERRKKSKAKPIEAKRDGQFLMNTWETYKGWALPDLNVEQLLHPFSLAIKQRFRPHFPTMVPQYLEIIQQRMRLIQCPVLLMAGSNDPYYYHDLERTGNLFPNCQTSAMEGYGNFPGVEDPEGFAQLIIEFLQNQMVSTF